MRFLETNSPRRFSQDEALETLISARGYSFRRGVLGKDPDNDFRMAFRELNRLYVALKSPPQRQQKPVQRRRKRG